MEPSRAITELRALRAETDTPATRKNSPEHKAWKAKVDAVLTRSLGADSATLKQFRELQYLIGVYTGGPGEAERDARYFAGRVDEAAGLIDAAIYELGLLTGDNIADAAETKSASAAGELTGAL